MKMARKVKQKASSRLLFLIGEEWTGKSSAGNAILGRAVFTVGSDTEHVMQSSRVIEGRNVTVVDTPGWDFECSPDVPLGTLKKAYTSALLTCQGFPVLLLTIPIFQDQAWNQKVAQRMLNALSLFNDDFWKHTMLLFTRPNLLYCSEGFEGYLNGNGKPFQSLVEKCKHRYHVINSHDQNDCKQVRELLEKIEQMVQENNRQTLQHIMSEHEVVDNREMMHGCSMMEEHKEMESCCLLEEYLFESVKPEKNNPSDTAEQSELLRENRNLAMSRYNDDHEEDDDAEVIDVERNMPQTWDITLDFYTCDCVSNPQSVMVTYALQISVCFRKVKPSHQTSWVSFTVCGDYVAWLFIIILYLFLRCSYEIYTTKDTGHETMKTLASWFGEHQKELCKEKQGSFHSLQWPIHNSGTTSLDNENKIEEDEKEEEEMISQQSNKYKQGKQFQQIMEANEILQFKRDDNKEIPEHDCKKDNDENILQKWGDNEHQLQHGIMEDGKQIRQNNKRNDGETEHQSNTKQPHRKDNDKSRNNSRRGGVKKIGQKTEMVQNEKTPKHSRRERKEEMLQHKINGDCEIILQQSKRCEDELISKHNVNDMGKIFQNSRRGSKQEIPQNNRRGCKQEVPHDNRRSSKQKIPLDNRRGSKQEIPQDNRQDSKKDIPKGNRRGSKQEIHLDNTRGSKQDIPQDNSRGVKQDTPQDNKRGSKQEISQDNRRGSKQEILQDNRRGSTQEITQDSRRGSTQEITQDNRRGSTQEITQDSRRGSTQEIPQDNRQDSKKDIPKGNRRGSKQEIHVDNTRGSKQEMPQDNTRASKQEITQNNRRGSKQEISHNNRSGSKHKIPQDKTSGSKQEIPQDNRRESKQDLPLANINGSKQEIPQDTRRGSKQEIPHHNKSGSKQEITQCNRSGSKQEISQDSRRRGDKKGLPETNKKSEKKQIQQQSGRENEKTIPQHTIGGGAEVIKEAPRQQVEGINCKCCRNQQTKDISNFTDAGEEDATHHGGFSKIRRNKSLERFVEFKRAGEEDTTTHGGFSKMRRSKSLERFIEFNNAGEEDTTHHGGFSEIRRNRSLERFVEFKKAKGEHKTSRKRPRRMNAHATRASKRLKLCEMEGGYSMVKKTIIKSFQQKQNGQKSGQKFSD